VGSPPTATVNVEESLFSVLIASCKL